MPSWSSSSSGITTVGPAGRKVPPGHDAARPFWHSLAPVKRLVDLTAENLVAHPVWRYEGGSGAQAQVSSTDRASLSQNDDEIFLASTEFDLADGSRHAGFCFPTEGAGVDYLQPVIVTAGGHVPFWFEEPVSEAALAKQWKTLGRPAGRIFPVAFRCLVPVDGRTVRGRIDGIASSAETAPEPPPAGQRGAWPPETRRRAIGAGETRTLRRRPAEMTVEFTQGTLHGTGVTGDISRRGMFVRSSLVPGTGPVLRLTVNLPGGRKLALTGRVVRSVDTAAAPASGFGLRLVDDWPEYDEIFGKRTSKK